MDERDRHHEIALIPGTLVYAAVGAFGSAPTSWQFLVVLLAGAVLVAGTVAALVVAHLRRRQNRVDRAALRSVVRACNSIWLRAGAVGFIAAHRISGGDRLLSALVGHRGGQRSAEQVRIGQPRQTRRGPVQPAPQPDLVS